MVSGWADQPSRLSSPVQPNSSRISPLGMGLLAASASWDTGPSQPQMSTSNGAYQPLKRAYKCEGVLTHWTDFLQEMTQISFLLFFILSRLVRSSPKDLGAGAECCPLCASQDEEIISALLLLCITKCLVTLCGLYHSNALGHVW